MLAKTAPTDQRVGVRPISFVLDASGAIGSPVTLPIRPEDLSRTEPSRATVHQTLGRTTEGWVDHFGEGLPSVTISGHTGWRHSSGVGMDGVQSFEALNQLVQKALPAAKQAAIDTGLDPAGVKLLFVDLLDNFAWSVVPTQFVLRRSRSRPLLVQYNISMQAVATNIEIPSVVLPNFGTIPGGLGGLVGAISWLDGILGNIEGWVSRATSYAGGLISPIAATVKRFVVASNSVFARVNTTIRNTKNAVTGVANQLIGIASDVAKVGLNVFRTLGNIANLPAELRANLGRVASAYNEVMCIFSNALRPRKTYEDYTGLYGASNCSSTTGGRPDSPYANMNAFQLIQPEKDVASMNSEAIGSLSSLSRMDPVLSPAPLPEIDRNLTNIISGLAYE